MAETDGVSSLESEQGNTRFGWRVANVLTRFTRPKVEETASSPEAYEQFQREHGNIKKLVKENNLYVVHGISPVVNAGHLNRAIKEGSAMTWQDKLAVVLAKQPTVSASTVTPGEYENTWSPLGVILSSGTVKQAYPRDSQTVAISLTERTATKTYSQTIDGYKKSLQDSLHHNSKNSWNELVVGDQPQIAGIYLNLINQTPRPGFFIAGIKDAYDWDGLLSGHDVIPYQDIFNCADLLHLPVFVFEKGTAYQANFDQASQKISKGEKIDPATMVEMKYEVPLEAKASLETQAEKFLKVTS